MVNIFLLKITGEKVESGSADFKERTFLGL
jgi:hypothetical protein